MMPNKKINEVVLSKIKEMDKNGMVHKRDLIEKLFPPYIVSDIEASLNYLSHTQVENGEDVSAKIRTTTSKKKEGLKDEVVDDAIFVCES